jgi:hypothetical protein
MRLKLVIFIILLSPSIMKSQNAIATLGNITSCAGENVLVPLNVTDFNDVGAMTIFISYDTTAAQFLSLQNINPSIPGTVSVNAVGGQVNIAYYYFIPFSITGEKLFDLSFTFLGDSTLLPFLPGTEIANSNLEVIPLDTNPGSIKNSFQIISQPDSVQSYPDNDVAFRVTSTGNPNFQWQENNGSGWIDLQNNSRYSGVTNDTLVIFDVPLDFNGNNYRCSLTAGNCLEVSDIALLEVALAFPVATLGYISSCPGNDIFEPLLVGDFFDVVEFTFNISFDTAYLSYQELANILPGLQAGDITVSPLQSPAGVSIHWENSIPVSVISDKLFDLKFEYEDQDHTFAFEAGTIVLNSFLNPVNITLNNGIVTQLPLPVVIMQPQNDSVTEPGDGHFEVLANGTNEYQWLVSTNGGNSWTDLTNNPPYYNVNTSVLTISPAVYSMNNYQFECRLENQYCTTFSEAAKLFVDTLTYIADQDEEYGVNVYPLPFQNFLSVDLPANSPYRTLHIYDIRGSLIYSSGINDTHAYNKVSLDLSGLPAGLFLLALTGEVDGKPINDLKKIVKTN